MRRNSVKPSQYPPLPFHAIRFIALLSAVVVAVILSVFSYKLHAADRRLPWAFLLLLISAFLAILNHILTTITHCCCGLSPRLSLTTNSIVLLIWLISLGLLSWSMSHTVLTTCNATYWGTSTGITVCRTYKALFAFTIVGAAAQIAAVFLDITVRRRQTRLGEYDPMAVGLAEYKPSHDRNSSVMSGAVFAHPTEDDQMPLVHHQRHRSEDIDGPYAHHNHPAMHLPPPLPPPYSNANASLEQYHAGEAQEYSDTAPTQSQRRAPRVRFSVYDTPDYGRSSEQTSYDPAAHR